jgi:hypothetical protein
MPSFQNKLMIPIKIYEAKYFIYAAMVESMGCGENHPGFYGCSIMCI